MYLFACYISTRKKWKFMVKGCKYIKKKPLCCLKNMYMKTTSMWEKKTQGRSRQSEICFYFSGLSSQTRPRPTGIFVFWISKHRHGLALAGEVRRTGEGTGPDMSSGLGEGGVAFSAHVIREDNIGPTAKNTPAQTETTEPVFSWTNVWVKNNSIKNNLQHFCRLTCVSLRGPNVVGAPPVFTSTVERVWPLSQICQTESNINSAHAGSPELLPEVTSKHPEGDHLWDRLSCQWTVQQPSELAGGLLNAPVF